MCQKCTRAGNYPLVNDLVYWADLYEDAVKVVSSRVMIVIERREIVRVDTLVLGWPAGRRFAAFRDIAHDEQEAVRALIERLRETLATAKRRFAIASMKMTAIQLREGQ